MPVIRIEFDDQKVNAEEAAALAKAVREIILYADNIADAEDAVVYAGTAMIKVNVHPIEIFIQMSARKIKDIETLTAEIKARLAEWKKEADFPHPITLAVSPEDWRIEVGI